MRVALVSQNAPGAPGAQSFLAPGLGPAAEVLGAIFLVAGATSPDTPTDPLQLSWGQADRNGNEWASACAAYGSDNGDPAANAVIRTTACVVVRDPLWSVADVATASLSAIVDNGVEITWAGTVGTQEVHCLLLADDGADDFLVGTGTVDTVLGLTVAPGWEADAVSVALGGAIDSIPIAPSLQWILGWMVPNVGAGCGGLAILSDSDPSTTFGYGAAELGAVVSPVSGSVVDVVSATVSATEIDFSNTGVTDVAIGWSAILCPENAVWAGCPVFDGSQTGANPNAALGFSPAALWQLVSPCPTPGTADDRASVSVSLSTSFATQYSAGGEAEAGESPPTAQCLADKVACNQLLPSGGLWRTGEISFGPAGYVLTLNNIAGTDQVAFAAPAFALGVAAAGGRGRRRRVAYRSRRSRRRHLLVT